MDNFIKLPKKNNTLIIFNKIKELVDKNFIKLNIIHKKILVKYLYRVVLIAYFYFYDENFIEHQIIKMTNLFTAKLKNRPKN